jgi:protein-S-isoprenylcysteine O-methyltransferase Ste14
MGFSGSLVRKDIVKMITKDDLIMIAQWSLFIILALTSLMPKEAMLAPLKVYGFGLIALGFILIMLSNAAHGSVNPLKLSAYSKPNARARLVTVGIYQYLRHPIYAGFIWISFGIAFAIGNYGSVGLALLSLAFYYFKSWDEEKRLMVAYPEYSEYRKRVGRFFPKIILN